MKVCKFLWRRALALCALGLLGLAALCVLSVSEMQVSSLQSVDVDDQTGTETSGQDEDGLSGVATVVQAVTFVGDKLRGLYSNRHIPLAGLRSIKVANDDYVRSLVRGDHLASREEGRDYDSANDILVSDEEGDTFEEDLDEDARDSNREFQEGDFDYDPPSPTNVTTTFKGRALTLPSAAAILPRTRHRADRSTRGTRFSSPFQPVPMRSSQPVVTLMGKDNVSVVEDGLFWSSQLERKMPKGVSDAEVSSFLDRSRTLSVSSVEPPTWNRCGRPKNQFVVLSDGTQACARYRAPHDYLVQGEVMSFYLSRLLGIDNVPAVCLSPVSRWKRWSALNKSLELAGWMDNATVALIQWVDGLDRDKMPSTVLEALEKGHTISPSSQRLKDLSQRELLELLQWSDLIVFDYITGNYDRVASMQDAADREQRPSILQETIHNLVKSRQTQSLWLIDNESGLLDSYSLLYGPGSLEPNQKESRFVRFHRDMLATMCVFRRTTYQRVRWLKSLKGNAAKYLVSFIKKHEPQFKELPSVFNNREFVLNFHKRIVNVYHHIKQCQVL